MEISSQRLIIRTMVDADIDGFYEIFSRDEIDRFVHKLTRERVERFFLNRQKNPNPYDFAVFLKDSGKMIGNLVAKVNKDNNFAEISYVFHPDFWNNGYCTEEGDRIYNPRSVVCALQDGKCRSYWTNTGKMKEVSNYINANIGGVKDEILAMLSGQEIPTTLGGFDAEAKASYKEKPKEEKTKDLILSGMTVLGFLSYYLPKETLEFYKTIGAEPNGRILKIPNKELKLEFERIITSGDVGGLAEVISDSKDMLQATIDKDEEKMAKILEKIHKEHCSYFEYNKEIVLSFVVTTAYLYATTRYVIKKEDVGPMGRADFVFYPIMQNDTAFVIELKKDETPDKAIEQIKEKEYFIPFKNFKGRKLLIGITYNTNDKKHQVKIEELE